MSTQTDLFLQGLLGQLVAHKAQELHLAVGQQPVIRQDGALKSLSDQQVLVEALMSEIIKSLLSDKEWEIFERDRSIIVIREMSSLGRFRVNLYHQRETPSMTMRLIPTQVTRLVDLGLPQEVEQFIEVKHGLVFISGPFDSGRTTVVSSMLQAILERRQVRMMTLEKPLEYLLISGMGFVEQRNIGSDVKNFQSGLQMVVQEDIEVIFVSNIPDYLVAHSVVKMALAGRLVFVVMNSDSAVRTLEEFIDLAGGHSEDTFASDTADALHAVLNLRLLPRQGGVGRALATEVLLNTPAMQLALKERDFSRMHTVMQTSRQEGMQTMDQALYELVKQNVVSLEDALEAVGKTSRLKSMIGTITTQE